MPARPQLRRSASLVTFAALLTMAGRGSALGQGAGGSGLDLPEISVAGTDGPRAAARSPTEAPLGSVSTPAGRERVEVSPAVTIADLLRDSPGLFLRQGNGPRDLSISIRGNNARNVTGNRNLKAFEDGFLITQPDGASRFDLADPHVYAGIDVFRGPQSPLFGNYATGGAINFRTRRGAEIDGVEQGVDAGSFGYVSNYVTIGKALGDVEFSLFASDARGTRAGLPNSAFDTQTINFLGTWAITPTDRLTVKFINNVVEAQIPPRLSLDQFALNPLQRGCRNIAPLAPGCATFNVFQNGAYGVSVPVTPQQTGGLRRDRRTIAGLRYEHDVDAGTTWRTQLGFDDRRIYQPVTNTATDGDFPSINLLSDVTRRGSFLGLPATGYAAISFDSLDYENRTFNVAPLRGPVLGAQTIEQSASHTNLGGRVRGEVEFAGNWFAVLGVSAEGSSIVGRNTTIANSAAGRTFSPVTANRDFLNVAPEFALQYRPNEEWRFRGRVATGYGTPSPTNLFITSAGLPGNNTSLEAQRNLGLDIGTDWTPLPYATVGVTGFYEFFRNEILTQSPGVNLMSFQFNAPASEHRGVEVFGKVDHPSGWNGLLAYAYNDQIYTRYTEQLSAGAFSTRFDRAGLQIPGVPAHTLTLRLGYDQPDGPLKGLGAYVEGIYQDDFFIDNANLVKLPGFGIVNVNVHYRRDIADAFVKRVTVYVEGRNVLDRRYASAASIVTNTISPATGVLNPASTVRAATGTVFGIGEPAGIFAGLRLAM